MYKYTKMYFLLLLYLLGINGEIKGSGGGRLKNFCPFYLFGKKESARLPPRELSAGAGRCWRVIMKTVMTRRSRIDKLRRRAKGIL